jgi:hypothetical protein
MPLSYDARSVFSLFSMKYMGSCPLNRKKTFSLTSPLPKLNVLFIQTVCVTGGGGGMLNCAVDHILQEFYTLFLARFRTYKIATPPQTNYQ